MVKHILQSEVLHLLHQITLCSVAVCITVVFCGCSNQSTDNSSNKNFQLTEVSHSDLQIQVTGPIQPLIAAEGLDQQKVALGYTLFHDVRLSHDNSISCASCHDLTKGGVDGLPKAVGINGHTGPLNTPTVFNSSLSIAQFWDGRAKTLAEQVSGPVHNPIEMGSTWEEVLIKLESDSDLVSRFNRIYPEGLNSDSIIDAIATFEKSLITVDSPFDRYLLGDHTAISQEAKQGHKLFENLGCSSCHQGRAVGGNLFQKFGVMKEYFEEEDLPDEAERGRFNVTAHDKDLFRYKVPSLRNVEQTAPYFHDGTASTLSEAVQIMAEHQLGMSLERTEVEALVAFLNSLTGVIPDTQDMISHN